MERKKEEKSSQATIKTWRMKRQTEGDWMFLQTLFVAYTRLRQHFKEEESSSVHRLLIKMFEVIVERFTRILAKKVHRINE